MWVACARIRCRIACRKVGRGRKEPVPDRVPYVGRGRKEPVPDTAWGMVVACGIAGRRIACGTALLNVN